MVVGENAKPLLIAHGGGNQEFPDNTLEAYYNAYSIDPNCMLETDVSMTKDGVIILSHDTTLARKTNITDAIIDVNYSDLMAEEVDFGYDNNVASSEETTIIGDLIRYTNYKGETVTPLDVTYPEGINPRHASKFMATTLSELITKFPVNAINVEIKQSGTVGLAALAKVIELMDDLDEEYHTYERIVLASFHKEVYQQMGTLKKTTHPQMMYSPEYAGVTKFYILQLVGLDVFFDDPVTVFQIPMSEYGLDLTTKSLINAAHKHNIAVHYWTINDENDMRLLIERGADGIMTDIPSRLKRIYDEISD